MSYNDFTLQTIVKEFQAERIGKQTAFWPWCWRLGSLPPDALSTTRGRTQLAKGVPRTPRTPLAGCGGVGFPDGRGVVDEAVQHVPVRGVRGARAPSRCGPLPR